MARAATHGMLFATSAVASSMLLSCSSPPCGDAGFYLVSTTDPIASVTVSDVACQGVTPPCLASDDAGTCTKYWVLPIATGNCHVEVSLAKGTVFGTDVKINHGNGSCNAGLYPAVSADSIIEVP
jgi:hypothetical protein